ncbi:MAG: tyrosine-type recombinase/integrase [Coriobacteriales bacterium]|nr:tyrosine-type recombinase/integrase [Coriobacteriales bacterium]
MAAEREYRSTLAAHIAGLVEAKRARGYDYSAGAYALARLDRFCVDTGFSGSVVTPELSDSWAGAIPSEGGSSRKTRMGALRQLALYELSLGLGAYVPRGFSSREKPMPYLPSAAQTSALFEAIDAYEDARRPYLAAGYRVAFRLMRLCGLRLAECANLAAADADAAGGTLLVRHSKGDKDRIVYMADDVASMVGDHLAGLRSSLGFRPEWAFPGKDPSRHIRKTTLDMKFRQFWSRVPGSGALNARPTPHCLRHAFVVERMNAWMAEGVSLPQMMPYLAAYLGHEGPDETFYYYHQVEEAFSIVRERDAVSARVIPEAVPYEE